MSRLAVTIEGYTFEIEVSGTAGSGSGIQVRVDGQSVAVTIPEPEGLQNGSAWFLVDDRPYEVALDPELQWMHSRWGVHALEVQDLDMKVTRPHAGDGRIKAPIPGQISRVMVSVGERVEAGQPLLVLEAMKMENEIHAAHSGIVKSLNVRAGQSVALHDVLIEIR
jgi:biotin carboxyl carrier protein